GEEELLTRSVNTGVGRVDLVGVEAVVELRRVAEDGRRAVDRLERHAVVAGQADRAGLDVVGTGRLEGVAPDQGRVVIGGAGRVRRVRLRPRRAAFAAAGGDARVVGVADPTRTAPLARLGIGSGRLVAIALHQLQEVGAERVGGQLAAGPAHQDRLVHQ